MQNSETIHPEKLARRQDAGNRTLGAALEIKREQDHIVIRCEHGQIILNFLTSLIVKITIHYGNDRPTRIGSGIVIEPDVGVEPEVQDKGDQLWLITSSLKVAITKADSQLLFYDAGDKLITRQESVAWNEKKEAVSSFTKHSDSHFYGLGEKTGFLDKAGERYEMWNSDVYAPHVPEIDALYQSIPFVIPYRGQTAYGLFLDNPGRTVFDMRSWQDTFTIGCETGSLTYYLIQGPSIKEVVSRYTDLTGRIQLPPLWSLGYHQSRYSYMTQEEVLELAASFREKQIPLDAIYLDIHYMDEYRVFTFDPIRFPNPQLMLQQLREQGVRVVPIVDPGVKKDPNYSVYREGLEGDRFCKKLEGDLFIGKVWPGDSAFPDFTSDEASRWWGDLHTYYTELGIAGIWNDMNEPSVFNDDTKTMDYDVVHKNNGDPITHKESHNLYGLLMSKATYEGLERNLKGERPFVLTRAGYAGIQRYATVWTGDNRSFWEHMAMAIPMVLNLGLSGIPFTGPDIGGFAHHGNGELLARWTQMGALFPYCRNHSVIDSLRQEPWSFGTAVEDVCRTYIELRYRWMPLIYSLFYDASQSGLPILRPLLLEYPSDEQTLNLCDQFLLGSHILVAPILRPGTNHRSVYLPEGTWFDYWSGQRFAGGSHYLVAAPLDVLPIFVKEGGFIAQTTLASTAALAASHLEIDIYTSGEAVHSWDYYEDDGNTDRYKLGAYNLLSLAINEKQDHISFNLSYKHRNYETPRDEIVLRFLHVNWEPSKLWFTDDSGTDVAHSWIAAYDYDGEKKQLIVRLKDLQELSTLHITATR